jgi:hypothetical protein
VQLYFTKNGINLKRHNRSFGLNDDQVRETIACALTIMNWSTNGLFSRSAKSLEYYQKYEKGLVPGQANFKDRAMDNGQGQYVSESTPAKGKTGFIECYWNGTRIYGFSCLKDAFNSSSSLY